MDDELTRLCEAKRHSLPTHASLRIPRNRKDALRKNVRGPLKGRDSLSLQFAQLHSREISAFSGNCWPALHAYELRCLDTPVFLRNTCRARRLVGGKLSAFLIAPGQEGASSPPTLSVCEASLKATWWCVSMLVLADCSTYDDAGIECPWRAYARQSASSLARYLGLSILTSKVLGQPLVDQGRFRSGHSCAPPPCTSG